VDDRHRSVVQVCGPLHVTIQGRDVTPAVPPGQARVLLTHLVLHRFRPLDRARLIEALWPSPPPACDRALAALLSRIRSAVGSDTLPARSEVRLVLPEPARVDIEVARSAIHRAESAVAVGEWPTAWTAARIALNITRRDLLPTLDLPWVESERDALRDIHLRAWEAVAEAGLGLGGAELVSAHRGARTLMREEPLRESGYRLGMRVALRRGNPAEALAIYGVLRARLTEELGVDPGRETRHLFEGILASTVPAGGS
jgi:SARP family transcriptional regulator, regulator of embCAB operon